MNAAHYFISYSIRLAEMGIGSQPDFLPAANLIAKAGIKLVIDTFLQGQTKSFYRSR